MQFPIFLEPRPSLERLILLQNQNFLTLKDFFPNFLTRPSFGEGRGNGGELGVHSIYKQVIFFPHMKHLHSNMKKKLCGDTKNTSSFTATTLDV